MMTDPMLVALQNAVHERIARGDLDSLVAALILAYDVKEFEQAAFAWPIQTLLAKPRSEPTTASVGVATLGARIAFGADLDCVDDFAAAAARELAREPCPPLACIRDDDRLLLGIAAGVGVAAPSLSAEVAGILQADMRGQRLRRLGLDALAAALSRGEATISEVEGRRLIPILANADIQQETDTDRVAALWIATRLLGVTWSIAEEERSELLRVRADAVRSTRLIVDAIGASRGLDPILLYDALVRMTLLPATGQRSTPSILRAGSTSLDDRVSNGELPAHQQGSRGSCTIFCAYSHKDEAFRSALEAHIALLQHQRIAALWHDRLISPGTEWVSAIDKMIDDADIILLLVSADFMKSQYCFGVELARALVRHESGEARVIPIIIRSTDLTNASFMKLQALPSDGRPITKWDDEDEAWTDVALGIRSVAEELLRARAASR